MDRMGGGWAGWIGWEGVGRKNRVGGGRQEG